MIIHFPIQKLIYQIFVSKWWAIITLVVDLPKRGSSCMNLCYGSKGKFSSWCRRPSWIWPSDETADFFGRDLGAIFYKRFLEVESVIKKHVSEILVTELRFWSQLFWISLCVKSILNNLGYHSSMSFLGKTATVRFVRIAYFS